MSWRDGKRRSFVEPNLPSTFRYYKLYIRADKPCINR